MAALTDEFKAFNSKAAARDHAGAMYADAIPSHNDSKGKCLHGKLQIALAIKNAGIPGVTTFSPNTVVQAAKEYASGSTSKRGRPKKLPDWFDEELLMWVRFQREIFRLPVTKTGMLNHINYLVRGTAEAAKFEDGRVPMAWLKSWIKRNKDRVGTGTNRNLEAARDTWTTSRNCALHYVVLAEQLVGCGACVWNKDFDPSTPKSEMIIWVNPDLVLSFDETGLDMNQTKDGGHGMHTKSGSGKMKKKGGEKMVTHRYTLATHTASRVTGVGGSLADHNSIIPAFIFPGKGIELKWCSEGDAKPAGKHLPCSSLIDPETHERLMARVTANGKGGMDNSMTKWLLFDVLLPTFEQSKSVGTTFKMPEEPEWRHDTSHPFSRSDTADETLCGGRDASNQWRRPPGSMQPCYPTAITDGHGSHLTAWLFEALQDLKKAGHAGPVERLGFVLRPPHTTHVLQNEDVSNFPLLKPPWKIAKDEQLDRNARGVDVLHEEHWPVRHTGDKYKKKGLNFYDFFPMVKPIWEEAFSATANAAGWSSCGLRPFNCCVYWTVLKQETKAAALLEDLVTALPPLCRDQVRAMNAQAVLPAPDIEEDADLDSTDGFDAVQLNNAAKIHAKRLQLAKAMVEFLEEHPTGVNEAYNAAYSSHVQAAKKMEAPKLKTRVLTAGRQWGRGNLGNKSAWEEANKAFKERQDNQIKALEKEEEGERKAEETRREYQREAPHFIHLLIAAADNSAEAIDASLTDAGVKATLYYMGQLTFAAGSKEQRCKQLAVEGSYGFDASNPMLVGHSSPQPGRRAKRPAGSPRRNQAKAPTLANAVAEAEAEADALPAKSAPKPKERKEYRPRPSSSRRPTGGPAGS